MLECNEEDTVYRKLQYIMDNINKGRHLIFPNANSGYR